MQVKLRGDSLDLSGKDVALGALAPDFKLKDSKGDLVSLGDLKGKAVVLSVVPDVNTPVCDVQTQRFSKELAQNANVFFATVSKNTPDEFKGYCDKTGAKATMLCDSDRSFGKAYGVFVEKLNFLARAVFVIDKEGKVAYKEVVEEITNEPDYDAALKALKSLL